MANKVTRAAQDRLASKRSEVQDAELQVQAAAETITTAQRRHEEALRYLQGKQCELQEAQEAAQESKHFAANAAAVATLARARTMLATLLPQCEDDEGKRLVEALEPLLGRLAAHTTALAENAAAARGEAAKDELFATKRRSQGPAEARAKVARDFDDADNGDLGDTWADGDDYDEDGGQIIPNQDAIQKQFADALEAHRALCLVVGGSGSSDPTVAAAEGPDSSSVPDSVRLSKQDLLARA